MYMCTCIVIALLYMCSVYVTLLSSLPHVPSPSFQGMFAWPSLADVNTRARRLVSAWVKHQRREEQKQLHLMKVGMQHYTKRSMFVHACTLYIYMYMYTCIILYM